MSDAFYAFVFSLGYPAFATSSSPMILHADRAKRRGAYILGPTHFSPYDIPLLMKHTPRFLDFVSITEVFQNPLSAWFLGSMNTFPLDRHRADSPTVRTIMDRLKRGRCVVMFPEGRIPEPEKSALLGGPLKPGIARIALLAQVPIVPVVVLGAAAYRRPANWLPHRRTVYAISYGEPIVPPAEEDSTQAVTAVMEQLRRAYLALHRELWEALQSRRKELTVAGPAPSK